MRQIRISGLGGQGIILAGLLLGEAGVIDGLYVAGSNSYGAQARGSGCKAEIVFSDGPIDFPHVTVADILAVMSQSAYNQYCLDVNPLKGIIVYDESLVTPRKDLSVRQIGIPATDYAIKELDNKQAANMVFLGAFIEIVGLVSFGAAEKAVERHVDERFQGLNLKALNIGRELGRRISG